MNIMAKIGIGALAVASVGAVAAFLTFGMPEGRATSSVSSEAPVRAAAAQAPLKLADNTAPALPAASDLPGGASSLQESYQDWVVVCAMQPQAAGQQAVRLCTMSQQQAQKQGGQRVLAIELRHTDNGLDGVLMLPFGLSLDKGVTLQIDDGAPSASYHFRTCLPAGCVVPLSFDDAFAATLQKGTSLKVQMVADGGQPTTLAVSLKGFAAAQKRLAELSK